MKKLIYIPVLAVIFLFSCKPSQKEAVAYNNEMVGIQQDVSSETLKLSNQIGTADSSAAYALLDKLSSGLAEQKKKVDALSFKGDDKGMKNALLDAFKYFDKVFHEDYKKILDIRFTKPLPENAQAQIMDIVNKITKEGTGIDEKFKQAQMSFAKDYNIMLINQ